MQTLRAKLRRLNSSDYENMRLLDTDPSVVRFTPSRIPQTEEQTRHRLNTQIENQKKYEPFGIWVAEELQTGLFLGWFMLLPTQDNALELGFMLVQKNWGKGYATEIAQALINYAQTNKVGRIIATTNLDNTSSIRVLEKLGFKYVKNTFVPDKVFGGEIEVKSFELNTL